MRLTDDDLAEFATDGYLLVPGVVPEDLLERADAEVDGLIEAEAPSGVQEPGQHAWFPTPERLPRCDDVLRRSPALEIAEELVAPARLDHAFDHIQVATTVPRWAHVPGGPHIDGHAPGQDPPHSFTLLAGVPLTDQRRSQAGNLWVWPGSHLHHHASSTNGDRRSSWRPEATRRCSTHRWRCPRRSSSSAARGDLLLAHFLLGHNKGGNTADPVRRTIYYRLSVPGHAGRWEQTFLDPWTDYPRLTDMAV